MAKLSSGKTFAVVRKIHYLLKYFAVHQAVAIMYCTQQVIQGENLRKLKNREDHGSFPTQKFCRIRYVSLSFQSHFLQDEM